MWQLLFSNCQTCSRYLSWKPPGMNWCLSDHQPVIPCAEVDRVPCGDFAYATALSRVGLMG
jgi:hypothetical protein